jgi:hypothetical protein
MTNCNSCRWHWNYGCSLERKRDGCYSCPNFNSELLECKCTEYLTNDKDDCPNYEEYIGGVNNE